MIVAFCESHNRFEQFIGEGGRALSLNEDVLEEHHLTTDHAYAHLGPRDKCVMEKCC